MQVEFDNKNVEQLFLTGANRKYKGLPPHIIEGFRSTIALMQSTQTFPELKQFRGLNVEQLHGDKKGLWSVRVQIKYRIEFRVNFKVENGVIIITDFNRHYND